MPLEVTSDLLRVADSIARKFANSYGQYMYDDLLSEAYLQLAQAAATYEERGSTCSPRTYIYRCIELRLMGIIGRRKRGKKHIMHDSMKSLDSSISSDSDTSIGEFVGEIDQSYKRLEETELAEKILKKLPPIDRAIYLLYHKEGLTHAQIGDRLGLDKSTARYHVLRIGKRVKVIKGRYMSRRGVGHLRPMPPPRTENQRMAAAKFCRDIAKANILLGKIPMTVHGGNPSWYLATHGDKLLYGPFAKLADIITVFGLPPRKTRGGNGNGMLVQNVNTELQLFGVQVVRSVDARELVQNQQYVLKYQEMPDGRSINEAIKAACRWAGTQQAQVQEAPDDI